MDELGSVMPKSSQFNNMRARFQRHSDARIFNGWVQSHAPSRVVVQATGTASMSLGEQFHFEIHGIDEVALFSAELQALEGALCEFNVTSPVKRLPRVEDTRLKVRDMLAYCRPAQGPEPVPLPKERSECAVIDLSSSGLALLHPEELEKGSAVDVEVVTPVGGVLLQAEVRYCRKEDKGFRVGLRITAIDRLNRGRYGFFLQSLGG